MDEFSNPLVERYASREMVANFSTLRRFRLWRELWIALAETEKELGLAISDEQLAEMRAHKDDIDLARAAELESRFRHDVMAHIEHFGEQCPRAKPIIHLGATSSFVGDNTDLIQMRDGMLILVKRLVALIRALREFAIRERATYCLGFTHFQPAQPVTAGKRACLWLQDFLMDLDELDGRIAELRFHGSKGTVGTQASFLELFAGDHAKVEELDRRIAEKMGFARTFAVTGQIYPRKVDWQILATLCGIAQSAHKMATDIRLLQGLGELEEPFEDTQIGSSAMPYKRNPMRSERACSLARFLMSSCLNAAMTSSVQWLERSLDDSANRRIVIPESFMAADAVLLICTNVATRLRVNRAIAARNLEKQLPFLASEVILMEATKRGGDRQSLHQRIRHHSMAVVEEMRAGGPNTLLDRLRDDPAFAPLRGEMASLSEPKRFAGRAAEQVDEFVARCVDPVVQKYADSQTSQSDLRV